MKVRSILRDLSAPEEMLGDPDVCIAVLDGPVDLTHPCFEGADVKRIDTLVRDPAGRGAMSLHGTHVASLFFGQPGTSAVGLTPRCRGLVLPIFRDGREGRVPQLDLAHAVERAVEEGAHVINISGGERSADGRSESMLERALRMCEDRGVLVVAAVGNDGCDCLQAPAAAPSVLAVGATDINGAPMESNNWGIAYRENGVLAPGQDIEGAAPGGGLMALTGSSFATPVVSGVAALLVAEQLRHGDKADPTAAGRAILHTAAAPPCSSPDAYECRRHLAGRLDVARAHQLITRRSTPPNDQALAAESQTQPAAFLTGRDDAVTKAGVNAAGESPSLPIPHSASDERATTMDMNAAHFAPNEGAPEEGRMTETVLEAASSSAQEEPQQAQPIPSAAAGAAGDAFPVEEGASEANEGSHRAPALQAAGSQEASGGGHRTAAAAPSASAGFSVNEPAAGVRPSCGCGGSTSGCQCGGNGNGSRRQVIYAIGTIGYDFGTEARRDSFRQLMPNVVIQDPAGGPEKEVQPNIYDPAQMRAYLAKYPTESRHLIWTLKADATNLYALEAEPAVGMDWDRPLIKNPKASAAEISEAAAQTAADPNKLAELVEILSYPPVSPVYRTFRDAIVGQTLAQDDPNYVSRVSIPGVLTDRTARTFAGEDLPVVEVQSRGLYTWNEAVLVQAVIEAVKQEYKKRKPPVELDEGKIATLRTTIRALLDMAYFRFRNLGQTSADRAMNAAGTNAFLVGSELMDGLLSAKHVPGKDDNFYTLESIRVEKSTYCRPGGSDCQDVYLTFFDPENERRARVTYLFTFDVVLPNPIPIGPAHKFIGGM